VLAWSFARSIGLNNEQTKVFFGIMQSLKSSLQDPTVTTESAFQSFKTLVMANSAVVRTSVAVPTPAPTPAPLTVAVPPSPNTRGARPMSSKGAPDRPGSSGKGKDSARSSKSFALTPRDDAPPASPVVPTTPKTFTLDTIKQVVEYATRTYFQHFQLVRAVFCPTHFRPRKNIIIERLLVETVVPDQFELDQAVDLQQEEQKRKELADRPATAAGQEEKSQTAEIWSNEEHTARSTRPTTAAAAEEDLPQDDISVLVHQHMLKARAQLQQLIADNEKQLDAKLKGLEQRIGAQASTTNKRLSGTHPTPVKKK
jgi:hypothetical protein